MAPSPGGGRHRAALGLSALVVTVVAAFGVVAWRGWPPWSRPGLDHLCRVGVGGVDGPAEDAVRFNREHGCPLTPIGR